MHRLTAAPIGWRVVRFTGCFRSARSVGGRAWLFCSPLDLGCAERSGLQSELNAYLLSEHVCTHRRERNAMLDASPMMHGPGRSWGQHDFPHTAQRAPAAWGPRPTASLAPACLWPVWPLRGSSCLFSPSLFPPLCLSHLPFVLPYPKIRSRFGGSWKACISDSTPEGGGWGKPLLPAWLPLLHWGQSFPGWSLSRGPASLSFLALWMLGWRARGLLEGVVLFTAKPRNKPP